MVDERLAAIFAPETVAVVGASREPGTIGHEIFRNILAAGFTGTAYPVNPRARAIRGVRAYPEVGAVPDRVDLAIVAVPAPAVVSVAEGCREAGVKALVVVTAGFRETGEEGAAREARLRDVVKGAGMRLVGPNCMGVLNMDPAVRLNGTFVRPRVEPGSTAIMTQSGALGIAILEHAARLGLGVSRFASMGNKTDVSGNDLLALWEDDPAVGEILMYLESFGNPRNFVRLTRRIGRKKPILVVKSGRSAAGARAAGSHTGALVEPERAVEALFEQCALVRAGTLEELLDGALAFAFQPLPAGPRVAVVTNSGGPAIMAADALAAAGLVLADLAPATREAIRRAAVPEASVANPVDLVASGGPEAFHAASAACLADPAVDALVAIYTPPLIMDDMAVARALVAAARGGGKPVLAVFTGAGTGSPAVRELLRGRIPVYPFPEGAVRALGAMHRLAALRARPPGDFPNFVLDRGRARAVLDAARAARREWLTQDEALALLAAYGLPVARSRVARSPEEAAAAAAALGLPVVLKAEAPGLVHKTEAGGVVLGLASPEEAAAAFRRMDAALRERGHAMASALVMREAPAGVEVLLGLAADPKFGPLVAFGLGGIHAEILADVAVRLAPLTDADARRMVRAIRAYPILEGARGRAASDVPAVEDALLRLSRLGADFPEISEMDVNPLRVFPEGALALDARVRIAPKG